MLSGILEEVRNGKSTRKEALWEIHMRLHALEGVAGAALELVMKRLLTPQEAEEVVEEKIDEFLFRHKN